MSIINIAIALNLTLLYNSNTKGGRIYEGLYLFSNVYINGDEKASAPAPVDKVSDTQSPLQVGNRLIGAIDDFVMYLRALSGTEIKKDMNGVIIAVERQEKLAVTWGIIKKEVF